MSLFKGLIEILKRVKHSAPIPIFCPRCENPRIRRTQNYGILPTVYLCENCGYQGTLILEFESLEE